jgi:hypothetical protein
MSEGRALRSEGNPSRPVENDEVKMSQRFTNRLDVSRWTLFFLGLALSVFTWGLQYKLSLYDPPQASSHQMPAAKLLSRDEQALATNSSLISAIKFYGIKFCVRAASTIFPLFALCFSLLWHLLYAPGSIRRQLAADPARRLRSYASLTAFFFRPPPVLA